VTYEPQFVPQATYDSKFSTMLASGKIPDLVFLNDQSAVELQAVRDGAFADLSEILGGDEITKWPNLANRTEAIWQASLKKGRVFQIPAVVARITNHAVMNRSVLEETSVGTEPRDADELMTALLEASKQKIGGQKVYGFTNVDVNRPLFYRLFRVGAEWQRDDSGKLVHMIETENYQEMLTWLAAAWKDGAFDPNSLQPQTETTAWRSALSYEAISGSFGGSLFADAEDQHETTLDFFTLPGFDGGDPLIIQNIPYGRSTSISAEAAKDPDRLQVVLDTLDYLSAPWGSEESLFIGSGIEGRHYEFGELNFPISTDEHTDELGVQYVGVESGRTRYSAHPEAVDLADSFVESMKRTADHSEVRILEGLESDSETFISKGPQLKESFTDFENGVITGRESVDDLESFVSDWLSQGGESIRGEYEALLKEAGR
jgi:putative aldouronate transport system substrate-binding protein